MERLGRAAGSAGNVNDWARAQSIGLVDGPGVKTGHSIMWGFGLEAVDGAGKREALVRNAMYLGAVSISDALSAAREGPPPGGPSRRHRRS